MYEGLFDNWMEVQNFFGTTAPEPDEVLLASYKCWGLLGQAIIVYRRGSRFFWVCGTHEESVDLSGLWEPDEYASRLQLLDAVTEWKTEGWIEGPRLRSALISAIITGD